MNLSLFSPSVSLCFAPLLATAILLLATGSSWRARRSWCEAVGLGAGVCVLAFLLGWLPARAFVAVLPSASIALSLGIFAFSAWRFTPDYGQSGFRWTLHAATRPALGAALGALAGFWPMLFFAGHSALPLLCSLTTALGLILAHALDDAFNATPAPRPTRNPSDDDGGQPSLHPEETFS